MRCARFVTLATVITLGLAAGTLLAQKMPFTEVAPSAKQPLRFSAFAVQMNAGVAGNIEIAIERWTTDAERQALLNLVGQTTDRNQDKLVKALQDVKPRVGFIRTPNSLGWDLKYAWEAKLPDGKRQIVIATDKPVSFLAAARGARTLDYMFSLIEMQFADGQSTGEGKLLGQTSISVKNGRLELELYGIEPTRLTQITEKNPKVKKQGATTDAPVAQPPASTEPKVLADGAGAKTKRFDNMHHVRYIEIFLAAPHASTGNIVAACYNSMFSAAGIPASKDTAPQAQVQTLDFEKMKKDYGVLGASLNGPKLWIPDWGEAEIGTERDFNGIKASWVAQLEMGKKASLAENVPYEPMKIARKSGLGWNKGTTVVLIDDAEGSTWVIKGFELGLNPRGSYEDFVAKGAGNFAHLPAGWKVRVKTLDKDLIEVPESGVATIMPDELSNMYDKTGPGMTNYKP